MHMLHKMSILDFFDSKGLIQLPLLLENKLGMFSTVEIYFRYKVSFLNTAEVDWQLFRKLDVLVFGFDV